MNRYRCIEEFEIAEVDENGRSEENDKQGNREADKGNDEAK